MMPRGALIATFASFAFAACTPAEFVWDDAVPAHLDRYRAAFQAAAGERLVDRMPREQLLRRLRGERILWLGDHHRSLRLHALQRELLAQLAHAGVRLAFALEAVGTDDEPALQRFLDGADSLQELRAHLRRRWHGSWLDDPDVDGPHYGALLTFARDHRFPVAAVEPTPRLAIRRRDAVIAATVRELAVRWPDRLLVVHVGQLHLVGDGDVVARAGQGGLVLGAEPPPALRTVAPADAAPGTLWQSEGGLWWFAELLPPAGQAGDDERFATWPRMSNDATR